VKIYCIKLYSVYNYDIFLFSDREEKKENPGAEESKKKRDVLAFGAAEGACPSRYRKRKGIPPKIIDEATVYIKEKQLFLERKNNSGIAGDIPKVSRARLRQKFSS